MTDHQKAQIWRFFNSQTQFGMEIPFWLALDCLMQRELCGRACLGRAPRDREAWVVGKKQEKMYVVVRGSACVVEASDGGGTPSSSTMASEEEVTDKAMVEGPVWRKDPTNDLRKASHVFGCLKVPDAVQECLTKACSDARKLRSFLLKEIDRSIEFDELLVKEGFPPEIGLTKDVPTEQTFLTAEEEPEPQEEPEESSEDEDSDDPVAACVEITSRDAPPSTRRLLDGVNLHAIDATPARWRGGGLTPLDSVIAHPTH